MDRLSIQTGGFWVLQDFDTADAFGVNYDETAAVPHNRPINYGARYKIDVVGGIPRLRRVANTTGPIGGALCLPPKAPRILAQWALGCVPAKITTASPLKATPVFSGNVTGWTTAASLDEVECYTSDGSSPAVGTFGLLVVGTELGAQAPLFFQGGGGAAVKSYQVTINNADGTYQLQEYDFKGGSPVGSPIDDCEELNLSPDVPATWWVHGVLESDGVIRFSMPFGGC
jgi:hypothetical protein